MGLWEERSIIASQQKVLGFIHGSDIISRDHFNKCSQRKAVLCLISHLNVITLCLISHILKYSGCKIGRVFSNYSICTCQAFVSFFKLQASLWMPQFQMSHRLREVGGCDFSAVMMLFNFDNYDENVTINPHVLDN